MRTMIGITNMYWLPASTLWFSMITTNTIRFRTKIPAQNPNPIGPYFVRMFSAMMGNYKGFSDKSWHGNK